MKRLTPRQLLVLRLIADGLATKRIAAQLGVSESAVNKHVAALLEIYGATNRAGLVHLAALDSRARGPRRMLSVLLVILAPLDLERWNVVASGLIPGG